MPKNQDTKTKGKKSSRVILARLLLCPVRRAAGLSVSRAERVRLSVDAVDSRLGVPPAFRRLTRRPSVVMASTSASGSLATARPNARSLRASAWRVEKAALLSQGGPSRCARSARGAGASRGRTGAVVVEAKIWTDDGRRRAAELMGLTREVRPSPRAARHPRAHLLYFLSRGAFFFF